MTPRPQLLCGPTGGIDVYDREQAGGTGNHQSCLPRKTGSSPLWALGIPTSHPKYNQGQLTLPSGGFTKLPNERSGLIFDSHLHLHYLQFRNAGKSSFFK